MRALALTLGLMAPGTLNGAGVVNHVASTHDHGRFTVTLDVDIDADAERIRTIALDHDGLQRLSSAIVESQRLPPLATDPDRRRVVYKSCFLIHCFTAVMVESVQTPTPLRIHTIVEPALSDFRSGHSTWELEPLEPGRTRLHMEAMLEPRFWVPPVVGPWLVARKMRKAAEETGARLEELAR